MIDMQYGICAGSRCDTRSTAFFTLMTELLRRQILKFRRKPDLLSIFSYIYFAAAVGIIVYSVIILSQPYTHNSFFDNDAMELSDSWHLSVDGGTSKIISLPQSMKIPDAEDICISCTLPSFIQDGWSVSIYSSFQNITAYIDGTEVLSYSGAAGMLETDVPVTQILFIPMKPSYSGRELTIHYSSPLAGRRGVLHKVYLGSKTAIIYRHLLERLVIIIAGILLVVIGSVIIIYKTFSGTGGYIGQTLQYQGLYMFFLGLFFILQSGMNQLIFSDLNWAHFIEFYSIMLVPVAFILGVDTVEKHFFGKEADILASLCILITVFECFQAILLHHDYISIIGLTFTAFMIASVFTLVSTIIIAFLDRALLRDMKWILFAFLSLAVSAIVEVVLYYTVPSLEDCRSLAFGVLIHCFCTLKWIRQQTDITETEKLRSVQQADAKSSFLANMSHEIRTPVTSIIGLNDILARKSRDPRTLSYSADISVSGHELLYLINNILTFSKIESGKIDSQSRKYYLIPLIRRLSLELRQKGLPGNVTFSVILQPDLPCAYTGDDQKIYRILANILDNASLYTSEGTITFSVSGSIVSENTEKLYFSVKDTGHGMTHETLHNIFESFNSRDNREAHGIGLGLAIAGSLADSMGGVIEARSTPGTGSEFTLILQQTVADTRYVGPYTETDPKPAVPDRISPLNILLADDDPMSRKIILNILKEPLYITDCASDGMEALAKLDEKKYDLVLLDNIMPGMSGSETFRHIRIKNPSVPVVMLSAGTGSDTREKYIRMGFADFIIKPMTEKDLISAISVIMSDAKEESRDD